MNKQVIKNFLLYSIPDVIAKSIPFITLPIATAYLTLQDFGYLALFSLALIPFIVFSEFGQGYVINSMWFRLGKEERGELMFNLMFASVVMHIFSILAVTAVYSWLFPLILGSEWVVLKGLYWVLILTVLADIPEATFVSWLIIEQKPRLNLVIRAIEIVIGLSVYLSVLIITKNYKYVIIATMVTAVLMAAIKMAVMLGKIRFRLRKDHQKLIFRIGNPIMLRSVFNQLRKYFDKFYISGLYGSLNLAIYNFSSKFNDLFGLVSGNYDKSYEPMVYRQLSEGRLDIKNIRRALFLWFFIALLFSSIMYIFGRQIISWFTHGMFTSAYPTVILFIAVNIITIPFMGSNLIIIFHQKTRYILFMTVVRSILLFLFAVILIPKIGSVGAVIAIWIAALTYSFLGYLKKLTLNKEVFLEEFALPYAIAFNMMVFVTVATGFVFHWLIILAFLSVLSLHYYLTDRKYVDAVFSGLCRHLRSTSIKKR